VFNILNLRGWMHYLFGDPTNVIVKFCYMRKYRISLLESAKHIVPEHQFYFSLSLSNLLITLDLT
jgi:hypothetical protein